jgi:hypothetical protein
MQQFVMKGALDSKAALVHAASDRLWRGLDGKSHEVKLADHDVCNVLCTSLATVVVSVSCMQMNLTACQNGCCSSSCMLQIAELVLEVEFWVQLPLHAMAFLQLF